MQKIMTAYKDKNFTPHIETSDNAFKITLPNVNNTETAEFVDEKAGPTRNSDVDSDEQIILDFLHKNKIITRADVEEMLDVGTATAYRILKLCCKTKF